MNFKAAFYNQRFQSPTGLTGAFAISLLLYYEAAQVLHDIRRLALVSMSQNVLGDLLIIT